MYKFLGSLKSIWPMVLSSSASLLVSSLLLPPFMLLLPPNFDVISMINHLTLITYHSS
jgi:hypothetical protein